MGFTPPHQHRVEMLRDHGADVNATPDHNDARPVEIAGAPDTRRGLLIDRLAKRAAT
jgi:hypothetical protein